MIGTLAEGFVSADAPSIPGDVSAIEGAQPGAGDAVGGVPVVSIVMANHNGGRFIEEALRSALAQTLHDIEVIVADDASTDDSTRRIAAIAAGDDRVQLVRRTSNGGAAAARNTALALARGTFVAVVDSDDLMHPDRLRRLVALAEAKQAAIVADDVLAFQDDLPLAPTSLLKGKADRWVSAAEYVCSNAMDGEVTLGYLKPLIRRTAIEAQGLRYDCSLPIAEDFAFVLELLTRGARFWICSDLTYFYRRHDASLSHRLSVLALTRMQAAAAATIVPGPVQPDLVAALARRRRGIEAALAFERLIEALKQRDLVSAVRVSISYPRAFLRLSQPIRDRLSRGWGQLRRRGQPTGESVGPGPGPRRPTVCLISRQRIVGATNGSSAYLISLCRSLHEAGFDVHLVSPSPAVFGRWPALVMRPEMALFRSIQIRGAWRVGKIFLTRDPLVFWRAAITVVARLLTYIGVTIVVPKAAYSIGVPWQHDDFLFLAQHGRRNADAILTDYAFLNPGIPYILRPDAPSAVVMHDLFSSRLGLGGDHAKSLVQIDADREMALLGTAGAIVAIQAEEAEAIRRLRPDQRVILAPMAVSAVAAPQPGRAPVTLFVGSNTGPNIDGLGWFLDQVWPSIRAAIPTAELLVAGGVVAGVPQRPGGVSFLGQVPDLAPLYRDAAVIVSPLRHGSGLKIKLVEALANGKACVVTGVTMQGVDDIVGGAVIQADSAAAFSQGVVTLLSDDQLRAGLCALALDVARRHFSVEACYGGLTQFYIDGLALLADVVT